MKEVKERGDRSGNEWKHRRFFDALILAPSASNAPAKSSPGKLQLLGHEAALQLSAFFCASLMLRGEVHIANPELLRSQVANLLGFQSRTCREFHLNIVPMMVPRDFVHRNSQLNLISSRTVA